MTSINLFFCFPRLRHISGSNGPTEMVHLSKFVEFNEENNWNSPQNPIQKIKWPFYSDSKNKRSIFRFFFYFTDPPTLQNSFETFMRTSKSIVPRPIKFELIIGKKKIFMTPLFWVRHRSYIFFCRKWKALDMLTILTMITVACTRRHQSPVFDAKPKGYRRGLASLTSILLPPDRGQDGPFTSMPTHTPTNPRPNMQRAVVGVTAKG